MRKKSRIFSFFLISLILFCSFFLFSSLIFPEEAPKNQVSPSLPDLPENQNNGEEEPAITLPDNPSVPNEINTPEEEGEKTQPSHQQESKAEWDDTMLEKLSFLQTPLPGAGITTRDSQLPGAPRAYRHGVHEGLDFYSGYCGIQVNFGDPVFAAGPGVIYRIDHDYIEPSVEERTAMLQNCMEKGDTPEEILDKLRGRQVWIAHPFGLVTRYAHLSEVADHLQEGDPVEAGDFLGNVGNSGTSEGARGEKANSHLHFEIWLENGYLGEGLAPQEIRSLWKSLLARDS
ncbi:MAG: M23 family metallopeptidase [Dethiobacteria bacterium]|jgi:murein DD-endopeptidase MepM/ murein hydrolase activator NlpD